MSEQVVENVQGTDSKKKKKGLLVLVLAIALVGAIAFTLLATGGIVVSGEARSLARELKKDGTATIVLDKDVTIKGPLVVNGKKTITGSGKIVMAENAKINWPQLEEVKKFSGTGCTVVKTHDTSAMPAMFVVSPKAELTIAGSVGADAANLTNVCQVQGTGSFTLKDKAVLENGRYCNVDVQDKGGFTLKGGKSLNGTIFNVINKGTTEIKGGTISGTVEKNGAAIYSTSKLAMKDGAVEKSACHNIYVAAGEFEMTGGTSGFAKADGIIIRSDAIANITGGVTEGHVKHGVHNEGKSTVKKIAVLDCGISNGLRGTLDVTDVNVRGSYSNALSNEGGTVTVKDFSTKNCEAIAICNLSGTMDLKDIKLVGGRDGNISIIAGEVSIENASLDKCREKSVSISGGKVKIKNIDVQGTSGKFNGVYVFAGELDMEDATIANTGDCGFRVDQAGFAKVKNVVIKDTVSTAIFGGRGTIEMEDVKAENIGGHGVYNTGGDVTITNFTIKKVRNVIQQRNGETTINNINADEMELGAYCQEGKLIVNGGKFTNSTSNGLRVKEKTTGGLPTLELKNVTISDVAFHGISNMGIFKGENVTIKNAGMNGFYNKETAKATVKGLKVSNITAYGISNGKQATLTTSDVSVENVGKDGKSNAVHNVGTMTVKGLNIKKNQRNGIYNVGKLTGSDITITGIKENGIYNNTDMSKTGFKGLFDVNNVTVYSVGSQGVSNMREATFKAKNIVIYDVPENGIRNHKEGKAVIDGGKIYNVDKHGINNDQSTLSVSNYEIYDVNRAGREFNLLNNSGKLTGKNVSLHGKAFRALYTNSLGTVSITGLKADGAGLSNVTINGKVSESKCVVSNNAGVMTLKDSTITNAKEMALYLIKDSKTTLSNLTIDKATTHGISAQEGTTINSTNLTVKNTPGTAVYNNGTMKSTNMTIDKCDNGVSCRGNGRLTLVGTTTVTETKSKAIQTWGDEKKSKDNRITVAENAKIIIDGTGDHAVLNRGQFLMNKSATITVKNVSGKASNAIYNYNHPDTGVVEPIMKLGTVVVEGIEVESNASVQGNAIANRGDLTLLGNVTASGFKASGANINSNRNYAGIVNFSGNIKGDANVTVTGVASEQGDVANDTMAFGVFVEEGTVNLGNIKVVNARQRAVHVGNESKAATLNAKNIVVDNSADRGIYMQNKQCAINVTESISVNKTGNHGIFACAPITVGKDVTITNVAVNNRSNGFHIDTAVKVGGNIVVDGVSGTTSGDNQGSGIVVTSVGTLDVEGDVTIKNITSTGANENAKPAIASANGLFTRGNTTIKGKVVIDNVANGNAVLCTNALLKVENLTVTNATAREAMLVYSNGKVEVNGGSITGAYGTTASDDDPDLGIVTVRNAAAKVTLNNFTIKDNGGCQYGIVTRIDAPTVETTNLTLEGCGIMAKGGSGKYILNGTTTIKDFDENGINMIQTANMTLAEGAILNISHPGEKNHAEAILLNNSATIKGENATINISNIKGDSGYGVHLVGTRSVVATLLVGTMTVDNCQQYAIKADKLVKNVDKVFIGSLKVTNCGYDNALSNVDAACYVLEP